MSQLEYTRDVVVIGGGAFGSTLASILAAQGKKIALWVRSTEQANEINSQHSNGKYLGSSPLDASLTAITDLQEAVKSAPALLLAIPTQSIREIARKVGDHVSGDQIIVHAAKGLELGTYARVSDILREETCVRKIGVLSGPNLAKEMILGQPAGVVVASAYPEVSKVFQELYFGSLLRVYRGSDVVGTEIAGAFKNIVAFMVGIAHGMGYLDNTKALLITRGLHEMVRFGVASGGEPETFSGLSGVGDLMATCYSPFSRNRQVGERVGRGENWREIVKTFGSVVEGITTTKAVFERAQELKINLPLVSGLYSVLYKDQSLKDLADYLMHLPAATEDA